MSGSVIGKSMNLGFPGTYAEMPDNIIKARPVNSTSAAIAFGAAVKLNADGTYALFGAASAFTAFAGVAVRDVHQAVSYTDQNYGSYLANQPCPVLERGEISVKCNVGTPAAGGAIYVRIATNAAIPAGVVGEFEAAADGANTVQLTNCAWANSGKDVNNVATLCLKTRNNP